MRHLVTFTAIGLALVATGCGGGSGKQPVHGTIEYKGRPLEGSIRFVPEGGPGEEAGAVVRDGRFAVPAEFGLPPGRYKVLVSAPDPKSKEKFAVTPPAESEGVPPAREQLPAHFNTATKLRVDVRAGANNEFDFHLE